MNKSESKYFNTARRMDAALLDILRKKSFEYVTVKELCAKAGVNRSTFYFHYENTYDLLSETVEMINEKFRSSYSPRDFSIDGKNLDELFLMTDEWIIPYLNFIKENKYVYKAVHTNASAFGVEKAFGGFFEDVFSPILSRYGVPKEKHGYIMEFYRNGLTAVLMRWVSSDCKESAEYIMDIIKILFKGQQNYGEVK